jgi:protease II
MADTPGLEPGAFTGMGVQVPPPADFAWFPATTGRLFLCISILSSCGSFVARLFFLSSVLYALSLSACAPLSQSSSSNQIERRLRQELSALQPLKRNTSLLVGGKELFSLPLAGARHEAIFEVEAGKPKLFWDPNVFLQQFPKSELGELRIHPSGEELAFTADLHLTGHFSLFVTSARRLTVHSLSYADTSSFEWSPSGDFLCSVVRVNLRPASLRCGSPYQKDSFSEVFYEQDEKAVLSLEHTIKPAHLLVVSEAAQWVESSLINFAESPIQRVIQIPRTDRAHRRILGLDPFTVISKDQSGLAEIQQRLGTQLWRTLYRPSNESFVVWAEAARSNKSVWLLERSRGLLNLINIAPSGLVRNIRLFASTTASLLPGQPINKSIIRLVAESPAQPPHLLNIDENAVKVINSETLLQDSEAANLEAGQLFCPSSEGVSVPLTFVRLKSSKNAGYILLEVYAAYGVTTGLRYDPIWPLLKRGFMIATAQARGSGYFGPRWHQAGVGLNKENSILDLLACARFLKQSLRATSIILYARSAGALVAASAAQREPRLFAGLILDAPFLDVKSYLYTKDRPLARYEYAEWGDPTDPRTPALLDSYAPMPPTLGRFFPPTLLLLSRNDVVTPATDALAWADAVQKQLPETQLEIQLSQEGTHHSEVDEAARQKKQAIWMRFALEHAATKLADSFPRG